MQTAIVGLPMVGKTSLFTILTGVHEAARVGLLEARVGVTKVPDARLDALAKIFDPPKITFATVEYLDFPAISKESLPAAKSASDSRMLSTSRRSRDKEARATGSPRLSWTLATQISRQTEALTFMDQVPRVSWAVRRVKRTKK